jgi:hypothetical protein
MLCVRGVSSDGCLGCENITYKPVTLADGRVVCNTCEEWRHECEVRSVMGMRSKKARQDYLHLVEEKRGTQAVERIKADVLRLWDKR